MTPEEVQEPDETVGELVEDAKENVVVYRGPYRIQYIGEWDADGKRCD